MDRATALRALKLAVIRADRIARRGEPRPTPEAVQRDAAASSRMAGIPNLVIQDALSKM